MNTVKSILEPILGTYQAQTITETHQEVVVIADVPQTVQYTEQVVIPDYQWLAAALVFSMFVYSLLRMVGRYLTCKI